MSVFRHLKAWIRRGRLDDELREELAQHVAWKTDSLIADGVPEDEARRRASVEVGNLTRLREQSRALWGFASFDSVVRSSSRANGITSSLPTSTTYCTVGLEALKARTLASIAATTALASAGFDGHAFQAV